MQAIDEWVSQTDDGAPDREAAQRPEGAEDEGTTELPIRVLTRSRWRELMFHRVLDSSWDGVLWACLVAAAATPVVCLVFPSTVDLAVFAWLMFITSSPTSTFLPAASEPIVMAFGKLFPPVLLASVGVLAICLVEWINYRLFGVVLYSDPLASVRSSRCATVVATWFDRQPFIATVIAAATPIPFWAARICAVLSDYPLPRFIAATAIGRFPRLWFFAFLGRALPFQISVFLIGGVLVVLVVAVVSVAKNTNTMAA